LIAESWIFIFFFREKEEIKINPKKLKNAENVRTIFTCLGINSDIENPII
jgi:hypothetical protein